MREFKLSEEVDHIHYMLDGFSKNMSDELVNHIYSNLSGWLGISLDVLLAGLWNNLRELIEKLTVQEGEIYDTAQHAVHIANYAAMIYDNLATRSIRLKNEFPIAEAKIIEHLSQWRDVESLMANVIVKGGKK